MRAYIAALLLSVATPAWAQTVPDAYKLPEGRLQIVSGSAKTAFFLSTDQTQINGKLAEIWIYAVWEPALVINGKAVVQIVERRSLECGNRTFKDRGAVSYGQDGQVLISTVPPETYEPPSETIKPKHVMDFVAQLVCDKAPPVDTPSFQGHAQALKVGQTALRAQQARQN